MGGYLQDNGKSPMLKGATADEQCRFACEAMMTTETDVCFYDFKYNHSVTPFEFQNCEDCCDWDAKAEPPNPPPPGFSPYTGCSDISGGCFQGCSYARGGVPTAPLFPAINATTCGCRNWATVPCDGGVPGQQNKWPCDPVNHTGTEFWYCEDGPGWKPPPALRARGRAIAQARKGSYLQQRTERLKNGKKEDAGLGLGAALPQAPPNPYATIWKAASFIKASANGGNSVMVESGQIQKGAKVHALRYAWPLGDDGDTCCPSATISGGDLSDPQQGVSACIPGACPLYSRKRQLPANPFFAVLEDNHCVCPAPQNCSL